MNVTAKITGPKLFAMYAYPCLLHKVRAGEITEDLATEFTDALNLPDFPIRLLEQIFPVACQRFLFSTRSSGVPDGNRYDLEDVRKSWRQHRGEQPSCDTKRAMVISINGDVIVLVKLLGGLDEQKVAVINPFNLRLLVGSIVYIHHFHIIEVE